MASPISAATAFDFGEAAQSPTTVPATSSKQSAPNETEGDTVKLSDGAQVRLLKTQGQTIAEIAINTALSAEAVNSYLGITQALLPTAAAIKK
jgi:hypothetical protein